MITSRNTQVVSTDFEARVLKVYVHNGDKVKAGDAIAELDTTALKAKLVEATGRRDQARGTAGEAYAMATNAKRKVNLENRLIRSGASTPEALRNAEAELSEYGAKGAAAAGQMKSAQSEMDELERLISRAHVVAPVDGVVSIVAAKEGAVATTGSQLVRVSDPDQLEVKFAVAHDHKDDVKVGQAIDVELDKGVHLRATVAKIASDADVNIDFNIAEAEFEQSPRSDEIRVGAGAHVRIADKGASR